MSRASHTTGSQLVRDIATLWRSKLEHAPDGAPVGAIAAREAQLGVVFPPLLRELYAEIDGNGDAVIGNLTFWSIHQLEAFPGKPTLIEFADFAIESHRYAIQLDVDASDHGWIYCTTDPDVAPVVPALATFLERYLRDDLPAWPE